MEGHWEDGVPDIVSSLAGKLCVPCAEQHLQVVLRDRSFPCDFGNLGCSQLGCVKPECWDAV